MKNTLVISLIALSVSLFGEYFIVDYVVRPGDTLVEIARDFGVSVSTILDWNDVRDPRSLKAGTVLRIPSPEGYLYTVKKGDTLYDIAKRFFTTVSDIMTANDMISPYIYPGQEIFVPRSAVGKAFNEDSKFLWPVYGVITSPYGWRIHPIKKIRSFHTGVDIAAPEGTPIFAAADGVVKFADENGGYGLFVLIDHGVYSTAYAHLSKIDVYEGQRVRKGQIIGRVGSTGISTGPHVHFEVRINGRHTNPLAYLPPKNRMYVLKGEEAWMGGK